MEIKDFPRYFIYPNGRVFSTRVYKPLRPVTNKWGLMYVVLKNENGTQAKRIHRLVAEAFIPNPNSFPRVCHKNEDRSDNRVENLEWRPLLHPNKSKN